LGYQKWATPAAPLPPAGEAALVTFDPTKWQLELVDEKGNPIGVKEETK
jgi:hypothetical protein